MPRRPGPPTPPAAPGPEPAVDGSSPAAGPEGGASVPPTSGSPAPDAPEAPPRRPGLRSAARALRYRNFRLFWFGAVLSNSGTWVQNVTVPFVVYGLTGSAKWLSAAAFAQLVPMALLSPVGGVVADRFDRRRVLLV